MSSEYFDRLNYLGGNLDLTHELNEFVDLEQFFLASTMELSKSGRQTQTILNWVYLFSPLLSPSKIRRLIKVKHAYSSFGLAIILAIVKQNKQNKHNWQLLDPYISKKQPMDYVPIVPKKFIPQPDKYLKDMKFIIDHCPEIKLRSMGANQVSSDIQAYLFKRPLTTLYQLAKSVSSPRNRVNEEYAILKLFRIISS